jgi:hypothetical protein
MKPGSGSSGVISLIRVLAVLSAVAIIACWLSLGANMGWSQTRVPVDKTDPVTETSFTDYEDRFLPGLDFLGAGLLGAAAMLALTFLVPDLKRMERR